MTDKENLTKEYIYQSFRQLLTKKKYDDISVCDICEKAGVSRMSFYRNFKSKEELTYKGISLIFEHMKERMNNLETKTTYSITKELFETVKNYQDTFCSFEDTKFSKEFSELISNKLTESFNVDYMSKTSKYIPVFYFGALAVTVMHWLKNGAQESPDEMARMIASLTNFEPNMKPCKHWYFRSYVSHSYAKEQQILLPFFVILKEWLTNEFFDYIITP